MAFKDIDRVHGRIIRRLSSLDGSKVIGYISGKPIDGTLNLCKVEAHDSLTTAREFCGFKHGEVKKTLPKSAYPQNQKGYDPHKK